MMTHIAHLPPFKRAVISLLTKYRHVEEHNILARLHSGDFNIKRDTLAKLQLNEEALYSAEAIFCQN